MKISRISVKGFKRFTNTTIENIPASAKLVMLVGPNGCGKSSLIDAVYSGTRRTGPVAVVGKRPITSNRLRD